VGLGQGWAFLGRPGEAAAGRDSEKVRGESQGRCRGCGRAREDGAGRRRRWQRARAATMIHAPRRRAGRGAAELRLLPPLRAHSCRRGSPGSTAVAIRHVCAFGAAGNAIWLIEGLKRVGKIKFGVGGINRAPALILCSRAPWEGARRCAPVGVGVLARQAHGRSTHATLRGVPCRASPLQASCRACIHVFELLQGSHWCEPGFLCQPGSGADWTRADCPAQCTDAQLLRANTAQRPSLPGAALPIGVGYCMPHPRPVKSLLSARAAGGSHVAQGGSPLPSLHTPVVTPAAGWR
jgi:hypothetical protein